MPILKDPPEPFPVWKAALCVLAVFVLLGCGPVVSVATLVALVSGAPIALFVAHRRSEARNRARLLSDADYQHEAWLRGASIGVYGRWMPLVDCGTVVTDPYGRPAVMTTSNRTSTTRREL